MKEEILNALNVPGEAATSIPNITIKGNRELIIENHKGIRVLSDKTIQFDTVLGIIDIRGENLEIKYMSSITIILTGSFKGISYEENKK